MKKKFIGWLTGSVAIMFLLPWAALTFIPSDAGMAVTLLLFFVIDPVYAITWRREDKNIATVLMTQ